MRVCTGEDEGGEEGGCLMARVLALRLSGRKDENAPLK